MGVMRRSCGVKSWQSSCTAAIRGLQEKGLTNLLMTYSRFHSLIMGQHQAHLQGILCRACDGGRACSRMLKTSACAFSTSSNRTTAYGRRLRGAHASASQLGRRHITPVWC